jgi:hypothetical protein
MREYTKTLDAVPAVAVPDWRLLEGFAQLFEPYGELWFEATDPRGLYRERELAIFREQVEQQDEPVESVSVGVYRGSPTLVWARAHTSAVWNGGLFSVKSTDESVVNHLHARAEELFAAARTRYLRDVQTVSSPAPSAREEPETTRGPVASVIHNPWTVAIGSGIVLAVLGRLAGLF